jgi:hypothetical protein
MGLPVADVITEVEEVVKVAAPKPKPKPEFAA